MSRLALGAALAFAAAITVAADSAPSSLRVGASVTRRCSVTTGPTLVVRCTRAAAGEVRAAIDGRTLPPAPLRITGPGTAAASIPLGAPAAGSTVTILF